MTQKSKTAVINAGGVIFFLLAVYLLIRSCILSFSSDIWYDELFSMEFASRPVSELISLTGRDVHPPFYYIIVKLFIELSKGLGVVGTAEGGVSAEIIAKLVSVLPFGILFIYAITTVRKHFGFLASGLFCFAIVSMPQLPEYTTEIRMYSWSILFVTAMLLHSFSLLRNMSPDAQKGWDIPDAVMIVIYSSAAAYTHYYAAFCAGIIYAVLFIWVMAAYVRAMKSGGGKKVNIRTFATVIVCMNLTAISYIPWVSVVLSQVGQVKENYWIQPVGLRSLGSCVKYLYKGYFNTDTLGVCTAVVLFALSAVLVIRTFIRMIRQKNCEDRFTMFSFMVLPALVLMGLVASLLIRPVFVNRYMLPAYGCFWLSLSIMAAKEIGLFLDSDDKKKLSLSAGMAAGCLMTAFMLWVGIVDYKTFIWNENYRKTEMVKTYELLESFNSDTIIISNFTHVQALLSYYLNKGDEEYKVYLYQEEPEVLIYETVPGLESIYDPIDIKNYLDAGKDVYFLGSFNSREDILADWEEEFGITYENHGSFLMERYWFDAFELQ